jgi:superfamily I DNA/RNA helicase
MDLDSLNPQQRKAVLESLDEDGRSIVIAGAGSGNTL